MRFHVGVSFKAKVLLKWLGAIFVGAIAFIGVDRLTANALSIPSNCSDGTLTDYATCSASGYYEITDDDISTGCNIAFGDSSSNNWGTSQVEFMLEYNVDGSDIGTTNDSNALYLIQDSRSSNGQLNSVFYARYKRDTNDTPLYLNYTTFPQTSEACQTVGGITCIQPQLSIYYCPDDTYTIANCKRTQETPTTNSLIGDLRFSSYKNVGLRTNAWLKNYYHTPDTDYNYIQINFSNMYNSDYGQPPPVGTGWNYTNVLFSSVALTSSESVEDNEHITDY